MKFIFHLVSAIIKNSNYAWTLIVYLNKHLLRDNIFLATSCTCYFVHQVARKMLPRKRYLFKKFNSSQYYKFAFAIWDHFKICFVFRIILDVISIINGEIQIYNNSILIYRATADVLIKPLWQTLYKAIHQPKWVRNNE